MNHLRVAVVDEVEEANVPLPSSEDKTGVKEENPAASSFTVVDVLSLPIASDYTAQSRNRCEVCRDSTADALPRDLASYPLKFSRRSLLVAVTSWKDAYHCPELSQVTDVQSNTAHLCESCLALLEELDEKETEVKRCVAKIREKISSWVKEEAEVVVVDPLAFDQPDTSLGGTGTRGTKREAEDPSVTEGVGGKASRVVGGDSWTEESEEVSWRVGPDHSYATLPLTTVSTLNHHGPFNNKT
jgi:hypothetical protein